MIHRIFALVIVFGSRHWSLPTTSVPRKVKNILRRDFPRI